VSFPIGFRKAQIIGEEIRVKSACPHSAAADAAGNIYVVEWITGGRVTKLEKVG